jgi:hypothetical protein
MIALMDELFAIDRQGREKNMNQVQRDALRQDRAKRLLEQLRAHLLVSVREERFENRSFLDFCATSWSRRPSETPQAFPHSGDCRCSCDHPAKAMINPRKAIGSSILQSSMWWRPSGRALGLYSLEHEMPAGQNRGHDASYELPDLPRQK